MTKAIIKTFNDTENAIENTFAQNVKTVYAPFIKAVQERDTAHEFMKGEKGAPAAKLAYDIEHGFRDEKGEFLIKGGQPALTWARHFSTYTVKELQEVKGANISTAYKNVNAAKRREKVTNKKPAKAAADDKAAENADTNKPANIADMAAQIVKTLGKKKANELSIAIADLCNDYQEDEKVAKNA